MAIRRNRVSRIARLTAVGAVAAVALTACIAVEADLTVNPDATASGTFSLELQKDAANFLGITSLDTFAEGISSGEVTGGDAGLGVFQSCSPSESDTGYVYACTFENTAFTDADGPWTIAKEGDVITFRMASESATEGQEDAANPLGDSSLGSINVTVEFPGTITSTSGNGIAQTSDTSVTISGTLTDSIDATITANSGGGFALSSLLVILLFVAILVLIVIVVIALIMRRRKSGSEIDAETVQAAEAIPVAPDAVALTGAEMAALEAPVEDAEVTVEDAEVTVEDAEAGSDTPAEETDEDRPPQP